MRTCMQYSKYLGRTYTTSTACSGKKRAPLTMHDDPAETLERWRGNSTLTLSYSLQISSAQRFATEGCDTGMNLIDTN